jgi:hypothetical protein
MVFPRLTSYLWFLSGPSSAGATAGKTGDCAGGRDFFPGASDPLFPLVVPSALPAD